MYFQKPSSQTPHNTLGKHVSPNQRNASPKQLTQFTHKPRQNNISITGYNNQIAIGANNVVLNVNLNTVKPKTPLSSVIYKHVQQQDLTPQMRQNPGARFPSSKKTSKKHSRNNSKVSTPGGVDETEWDQFTQLSQLSFMNRQPKDIKQLQNSMAVETSTRPQFVQSQLQSRNSSQQKNASHSRKSSQEQHQQMEVAGKNQFNLQYVIGIGGFGKVWKVQHKKSGKIYAMKEMSKALVITKKSVNSVMNERKLLSQLKHQFLVNMLCSFQDRENLYLVMDYLSGGDLRYHIGKMRRFSEEQTRFFIACIFVSLEYLHNNQVIHRDIKPENLVLDGRGYVRITDLGIARIMRPENSSDTSGTPGYMAPEVMCRMNHSYAVDYFALGVIGYEFMLGRRPYLGRSRKEIRDQILARQVQVKKTEVPDDWSLEAVDFINRVLLQRKPQNRLGYGGPQEVRNHPWLKNFPWTKLMNKELMAPYIPDVFYSFYYQQAQEDNFDSRQISIEDEENNELIQQNIMLLRRESVQTLFDGYSFELNTPLQTTTITSTTTKKQSITSYTQAGQQPNLKLFFHPLDNLLRTSVQYK